MHRRQLVPGTTKPRRAKVSGRRLFEMPWMKTAPRCLQQVFHIILDGELALAAVCSTILQRIVNVSAKANQIWEDRAP